MSEEWRDIPGFEGKYQVSTLGNVRSIDRTVGSRVYSGRILRPRLEKRGYLRLTLSSGSFRKTDSVHRLVAIAFIENPQNLPAVNHIDGNKTNNKLENLEWVTHSQNSNHAVDTGLFDHISGEGSHLSKFKNEDILEVVNLLKEGKTPSEVSRITKISRPVCAKINLGKAWRRVLKKYGVYTYPINKETKPFFNNKMKEDDILRILELSSKGFSQKYIAEEVGASQSTICRNIEKALTNAYKLL
jgi:hypothetical protein